MTFKNLPPLSQKFLTPQIQNSTRFPKLQENRIADQNYTKIEISMQVAPLLKVAFCQHQKKIVSLQFTISNYHVHVLFRSYYVHTFGYRCRLLIIAIVKANYLMEEKIWKMIALDVSE